MKSVSLVFCILLYGGFFGHTISNSVPNNNSSAPNVTATAIQIVVPLPGHTFQFQSDKLKSILENDDIKDREIVVVSIAGAFRQGKSFILNFFLKYLYAQYKRHDVSNWIGESLNDNTNGFKWRSGQQRETIGIWMWSEVFTHDYANGSKIAIILIDTQGIFDDQSSVRDCTTIFALSMMLSSVQCYNLMQNIKEDDLQHLQLFTEYGRLALEQSSHKPSQKLLFIVRDWPFAFESGYGWNGQTVINTVLAGNEQQTSEMRELRTRIRSSFENITAFLMPHPGMIVAQGNLFTGAINQIDSEFIRYVKELVPALFAPDKLIAKTVNGQKIRAQHLIQYLQAYVQTFNGNTFPEPKSVLMATSEVSNLILHNDLLTYYTKNMQMSINKVEYFKETDLEKAHQKTKREAIEQFQKKPKLGGQQLLLNFQQKLEADIETKFTTFKEMNKEKRQHFIEKANMQNEKLVAKVTADIERKVLGQINVLSSPIEHNKLNTFLVEQQNVALKEFDDKKLGDVEISGAYRERISHDATALQSALIKVSDSYNSILNSYANSMKNVFTDTNSFVEEGELTRVHQAKKTQMTAQFIEESKIVSDQLAFAFKQKLEKHIDDKFPDIKQANENKRQDFIARARAHNENLIREIKIMFENRMLNSIGKNYLNDPSFIGLFMTSKTDALNDFARRKMGDASISNSFRESLERNLDSLQISLKQRNEANKPPPPPPPKSDGRGSWHREDYLNAGVQLLTIVGGFLG